MRLTESQLRRMIKEEYLRVTPINPGEIMSEARATYLAEEMLNEWTFGSLFAGLKGGAKELGKKAGSAAEKGKEAVGKGLEKIGAPIAAAASAVKDAAVNAGKAIEGIKNDVAKAAAKEAAETLKAQLAGQIKKYAADLIKNLVASGMDEAEAQAAAAAVITSASMAATPTLDHLPASA